MRCARRPRGSLTRWTCRRRSFHVTLPHQIERLRVLFCGSDPFSIESLKALHEEAKDPDSSIGSIDVVTKTDKRTGRGLKKTTPPPIKPIAQTLGLPLHQIDTFRGWTPPPVDLIVAVSFGLLIPSRIIGSSKYGGLNVHPSLLPALRGAAPIQWAIIRGLRYTGVSIQTLHPTKFDEGTILNQTSYPYVAIPPGATYDQLVVQLAPIGADLLVKAIRKGLYQQPYQAVDAASEPSLAPRILPALRELDFVKQTEFEMVRMEKALGKLSAAVKLADGKRLRLILTGLSIRTQQVELPAGLPYVLLNKSDDPTQSLLPLRINIEDGALGEEDGALGVSMLTVEGQPSRPATQAAARAGLLRKGATKDDQLLYHFEHPFIRDG